MQQNLITITTDLGDQFATAQLRAVVENLGYTGKLIENHSVTPFSITEGAFQIKTLAVFCPNKTVHLGIIDPGVGSKRNGVVIRTKKSFFVGPDNGLFHPVATEEKILEIWKIDSNYFGEVSNTFHGRDYFIKAAVFLSQGKDPESFGCQKIKSLKKLAFKRGQVLHIDNYGNIKIYFPKLASQEDLLRIQNIKIPLVKTFSDVLPGDPLFYWGSSNTLELAVNLGNAANYFKIKQGDLLKIT